MAAFYTSVAQIGKFIKLRGYENGKRINRSILYRPYLFQTTQTDTPFRTLQGQNVERIDFQDVWKAKEYLKRYEDVSGFNIYGMSKWIYQFIHDSYQGDIAFDKSLIKVAGIDIEVDSEDGYPDIETANKRITSIALRFEHKKLVFGYGDYMPHQPHITYFRCKTEIELLQKFLLLWNTEEWSPDVVTGWNIDGFDIPYLVNRITAVMGEDEAKRLSPWRCLRERSLFLKGKNVQMFTPVGIAVLDYMHLYKKFQPNQQSSYSLNNIAHVELNEKKIDHSEYEGLAGLYKNNHQKFIEYNVHDVDLVFMLEAKLRFIELVYAIAYDAKVNLNDAFTSVLLWDVIIYNYLMDRNIVVPQSAHNPERDFEGGFVKDPLIGLHEWVMSFDLTSLYPHIIIQYNISPETFVEKLDGFDVDHCLKMTGPHPTPHALTANGCLFRRDTQGFLPALMELQFKQRRDYQAKMKAETNDVARIKYDKAQYAKKIQLNSLYGALANGAFRFYDPRFAEAITLSAQLSIRFIAREVNDYMNKINGTENEDYIIAIDTDSLYICFAPLVAKYCSDKAKTIDFLDTIGKDKLVPFMATKYEALAKTMTAYKQAMIMKRENIADKALWVAKKRYIMNVWDQEGKRHSSPKLKIMGIETVRSSSPQICRKALEESISLVMNKNESVLQAYIEQFKKEFFQAPFDEVAFPRGVNNLERYFDPVSIYRKGCPIHVKGALLYNKLLKERGNTVSVPIYSGDKIKFAYLTRPNPVKDIVIAAPGFLPFKDIEMYIDYHMQFEKAFLDPLHNIITMLGWTSKKQDSLEALF